MILSSLLLVAVTGAVVPTVAAEENKLLCPEPSADALLNYCVAITEQDVPGVRPVFTSTQPPCITPTICPPSIPLILLEPTIIPGVAMLDSEATFVEPNLAEGVQFACDVAEAVLGGPICGRSNSVGVADVNGDGLIDGIVLLSNGITLYVPN